MASRKLISKRFLVVTALLLIAGAAAMLYMPWDTRPVQVATETVSPGKVSQVLAVNGRIAAIKSVNVRTSVSAQAIGVRADEGEKVEAGQVLATLDTALIEAQLAQAEASLEAQQARQRQSQAAVERARGLGANSPRSVLEDAELALASAVQETVRLEAALDQVRRQAAQYTIEAPISGLVLSRGVDAGQLVDPQTELFVIADTRELVVETDIDELYSAHVRQGLTALLKPVGSTIAQTGEVVFAAPTVDSATGGRRIKIAFADDVDLPIGLTVNANLIVKEVENALSIPRGAIVTEGQASHVMIIENGQAVRRDVVFDDWPAERVVVTEGLQSGDVVVLDPAAVKPGDKATKA